MASQEIDEYNSRTGSLIGLKADIGDAFLSESRFSTGVGNETIFYTATMLAEKLKFDGKDCIKLVYNYNSDLDSLKESVGKTVNTLVETVADSEMEAELHNIEITGNGERIIDPSTLLSYSEQSTKTIKMEISFAGMETIESTVVEAREYTFEYK